MANATPNGSTGRPIFDGGGQTLAWRTDVLLAERSAPAPDDRDGLARGRAALEAPALLRDAAAAAADAAMRALAVAALLDEALTAMNDRRSRPAAPTAALPRDSDRLSPREKEVLALVTAGHSNKAIAEALFISPNTVKTHVASLLNKLHAGTRVELAAIATACGLGDAMEAR
ncbi:MAG TPA: helix-turn-helix transcriptional regulator [Thermomicrobiales bacterium]|nr:helix-turn-helix transcriptional regulator [Thermomicrobiales bacterium]